MIKVLKRDHSKLMSAVALEVVKQSLYLASFVNLEDEDTIYQALNKSDEWVSGQLKHRLNDGKPYIRKLQKDNNMGLVSDVSPINPDTLCAYTGYNIINSVVHNELKQTPVYIDDILLTYDRNTNIAQLLRVKVDNLLFKSEPLNYEDLSNKAIICHSLDSLCGLWVHKVGNIHTGIEYNAFVNCDFPYANVRTVEDDLAYLLQMRYLILNGISVNHFFLQHALDEYVDNDGKLTETTEMQITMAVEDYMHTDVPIAYKESIENIFMY